jgi:hypothetical protein
VAGADHDEGGFSVSALRDAIKWSGQMEIFNTEQGSRFNNADFLGERAGRRFVSE